MTYYYFDNAATTPLDGNVLQAMMPYLETHYGNPSSLHGIGRQTKIAIETARKNIASLLGCTPKEIVFTSGGTESNNLALTAAVRDLGCKHIITAKTEHHAVLHTIEHLYQETEVTVSYVKLLPDGHIDMKHLERELEQCSKKCLVSIMHANNEIGTIADMHDIGKLCRKHGAIFHSDTVQTVGHYPFALQDTPVDFITASAHKFHGPKGIGLLYINKALNIKPIIHGGGQERNLRAGTENVPGIIGLAKALEIASQNFDKDAEHIYQLKQHLLKALETIDGIRFNGDTAAHSLYTVLNVSFPKSEKHKVLY